MKDFLGVPLEVGQYVAAGGKGNGPAEYGMILYRVTAIDPKLKLLRLAVSYPTSQASEAVVKARSVTVQNTNAYVIVTPPDAVRSLFEAAVEGRLSQDEANRVGRWIHGILPGILDPT